MMSFEEFKKDLGFSLPITVDAAAEAIHDLWESIETHFSEREKKRRELQMKSELFKEHLLQDRRSATERAVSKGDKLLELRGLYGCHVGWGQFVRSLGISPRTAQNLIALALFAKGLPEVFERMKHLGPTKLYRLAHLESEALNRLQMDAKVPTERGEVELRNLTDRELEAHLRKINPPRIRTTQERIREACISMRKMLENLPKAKPPKEDLELIQGLLRGVSDRVTDLIVARAGSNPLPP